MCLIIHFKASQRIYSFSFSYGLIYIHDQTFQNLTKMRFCIIHGFQLLMPLLLAIARVTRSLQQAVSFKSLSPPTYKTRMIYFRVQCTLSKIIPVPLTIKMLEKWEFEDTVHIHTSTEVHQNENFPYIAATHIVDTRVNVTHNVLVPWQIPLWTKVEKYVISYRPIGTELATKFH
jgi:hypothetical protein